jgi:signal transduction histidine kinase
MTENSGNGTALGGLSARLLLLTIVFVMVSEVLIFVPSVARDRLSYLENRIDAAHLAVFALEATPDNMVSPELADMLLAHVGAHGIVVHTPDKTLMLASQMPPGVDATYDLRNESMLRLIGDAMATLSMRGNRVLRVLGTAPKDPSTTVELLIDEKPMRDEMWAFGLQVLEVSIVVSLVTAALVYLSLQWLLVAPLRRLTQSMVAFRLDPEDASRVAPISSRRDEIGIAQRELAAMQENLRQALRQKERLAALGTAVTKINHDLRGILSTVRLMSDRLAESASPEMRKVIPVLIGAIDRAVALCTATLDFTREGALPLRRSRFALKSLVADLDGNGHAANGNGNGFIVENRVPDDLEAHADRDQLFRALQNLVGNAAASGAQHCSVGAARENGAIRIAVVDDGPGLPPKARENLFRPFAGNARPGGTGLGLAIAREVMRAHGGEIHLRDSTGAGTAFVLDLPDDQSSVSS